MARLLGSTNIPFTVRLKQLRIFYAQHGNLNVLRREDKKLYDYLCSLRACYKKKMNGERVRTLTNDMIDILNDLGMNWKFQVSPPPSPSPAGARSAGTESGESLLAYTNVAYSSPSPSLASAWSARTESGESLLDYTNVAYSSPSPSLASAWSAGTESGESSLDYSLSSAGLRPEDPPGLDP